MSASENMIRGNQLPKVGSLFPMPFEEDALFETSSTNPESWETDRLETDSEFHAESTYEAHDGPVDHDTDTETTENVNVDQDTNTEATENTGDSGQNAG